MHRPLRSTHLSLASQGRGHPQTGGVCPIAGESAGCHTGLNLRGAVDRGAPRSWGEGTMAAILRESLET